MMLNQIAVIPMDRLSYLLVNEHSVSENYDSKINLNIRIIIQCLVLVIG